MTRSILLLASLTISCAGPKAEVGPALGLPPSRAPQRAELVAAGRKLFFDTRLSADNSISCATCHNPDLAFADGRKTSIGVNGQIGKRNSPTVLNAVYARLQFWDGRAADLEDQAGGPMANSIEMNQSHEISIRKLSADPDLVAAFEKAFGPGAIDIDKMRKALAAFESTLVSGNSAFDRYLFGGDKTALNPAAQRGLVLFDAPNKGRCSTCHLIHPKDALFNDGQFHNLGVGLDSEGEPRDLGRFAVTKREEDKGAFKTPILRNVARTAPYMHDGSLKTLRDVVDFYNGGGNSNAHLDQRIKPLNLSSAERDDLVAFLESLNGELPKPLD